MKTRKISTISQPLLSPDGTILKNMRVAFVLVDENGRPCSTFDSETGERIAGNPVYIKTDINGEFEVNLFPNTRGTTNTSYLVKVLDAEVDDFVSSLQDGDTDIDLLEFKYAGVPITPAQYDIVQKYFDEIEGVVRKVIDDTRISPESTWSSDKIVTEVYNPSKYVLFTQEVPATEWLIKHDLNRPVVVTVYDDDGSVIIPKVRRIDLNTVRILFSEEVSGEAYVR